MATGKHVEGKRTPNHDAAKFIEKREPFVGSNFEGGWASEHFRLKGWMPKEWWWEFNEFLNNLKGEQYYVVISFSTPIAWWSEATGWVHPPISYSQKTGRQQSYVYRALHGETVKRECDPSNPILPEVLEERRQIAEMDRQRRNARARERRAKEKEDRRLSFIAYCCKAWGMNELRINDSRWVRNPLAKLSEENSARVETALHNDRCMRIGMANRQAVRAKYA